MEQIVSMDDKRGGLRGRLERLRHSERAAWWFALLAITGAVQFLSVFAIGVIFVAFQLIIHHQGELSPNRPCSSLSCLFW